MWNNKIVYISSIIYEKITLGSLYQNKQKYSWLTTKCSFYYSVAENLILLNISCEERIMYILIYNVNAVVHKIFLILFLQSCRHERKWREFVWRFCSLSVLLCSILCIKFYLLSHKIFNLCTFLFCFTYLSVFLD